MQKISSLFSFKLTTIEFLPPLLQWNCCSLGENGLCATNSSVFLGIFLLGLCMIWHGGYLPSWSISPYQNAFFKLPSSLLPNTSASLSVAINFHLMTSKACSSIRIYLLNCGLSINHLLLFLYLYICACIDICSLIFIALACHGYYTGTSIAKWKKKFHPN